jgi:hypothetical protein
MWYVNLVAAHFRAPAAPAFQAELSAVIPSGARKSLFLFDAGTEKASHGARHDEFAASDRATAPHQ